MKKGDFYRTLAVDALLFNGIGVSILKSFLEGSKGAAVLLYHLVCDKSFHRFLKSHYLPQLDTALFKRQLSWLIDNGFSFVTIEELSQKIINGEEISEKLVAVTFDDGFKTTIENVLPILGTFNIKATFFITTDWIDSDILLWQQRYHWYLANCGMRDFFGKMKEFEKESFAGLSLTECHYRFMQDIHPDRKETLLQRYERPIPNEGAIAKDIYPSSQDILRLKDSGMEVGSHSRGHHFMKNLPDALYLEEMQRSKERLEELIKKPVASFSYPFNSYREDDEIVKKAGYKVLCTVDRRKVNKSTPLARLPRFNAPVRKILFKNSLRKLLHFTQ